MAEPAPRRIAVVGMSEGSTCGARDHAGLLAEALESRGIPCTMHWLWRSESSLSASRAEIGGWTSRLTRELESERPDAVLLHYSVFSYSHRGIPLFVHPVVAALRATGVAVVSVMHEYVYPWRAGDPRGNVWALTQRAALIEVVRLSRGLVVTTTQRAAWFHSRRWLARRPTVLAPVFSNLPTPSGRPAERHERLIGLFGYSYQGAAVAEVLDALRTLADRGLELELRLLGGPGHDSPVAHDWLQAASVRGLREQLSFSGILPAGELADALAACEVLLFADTPGPSSRKGTLAGSLASGRPVLALDGPQRWQQMIDERAAEVVEPSSAALADALQALLTDAPRREALGERGRAFAERMGAPHSAEVVSALLEEILPARVDSQ